MKLDTPLVKALMVGTVMLCIAVPFIKGVDSGSPAHASYTEAASIYLAGRSDTELNAIGDSLCAMYRGGATTDEVTSYLVNGGASFDSAAQLALVVRAYKCSELPPR